MFSSNLKFYLKSTIEIADTTSDTFIVSEDFELGAVIDTGGETVSLVLRNARQLERMEVTITAGVATIVKRGLDQSDTSTEDVNLKKQWTEGTIGYISALAFDLFDKQGDTMTGELDFSGTTNPGLRVNNLTTAQRTALTPSNGTIVYDTTIGEMYQYIGGAWSAMASGSTQPNASATVAGKVEIATTAQSSSGTDTGETGALLSVLPSDIAKNTQSGTFVYGTDTGGDDTYVVALTPTLTAYTSGQTLYFKPTTANTGACTVDFGPGVLNIKTKDGNDPQSGVLRALTEVSGHYDGTNFVIDAEDFATSNNKGIVEMCTDAEAASETDETRYVNAKQKKMAVDNIIATISMATASGTQTISHSLGKIPKMIMISAITTNTYGSGGQSISISNGSYDGSNNCIYGCVGNAVSSTMGDRNSIVYIATATGSDGTYEGVVTAVTTTDFTITWTKSNTPAGTIHMNITLFA